MLWTLNTWLKITESLSAVFVFFTDFLNWILISDIQRYEFRIEINIIFKSFVYIELNSKMIKPVFHYVQKMNYLDTTHPVSVRAALSFYTDNFDC